MLATVTNLFVIQGVAMTYSYGGSITQNMVLPSGEMAEGVIPDALSLLGQVPTIVIIMLAVTLVAQLGLSLTKHGRRMYAIGGNAEAARLSGILTTRYRVAAYILASLLAGLGGILLASRIGSSQVNAGGGYLMDAVAAAWIGFSLAGSGKPNALGTLVGAVILGVLQNGLVMLSVPYYAMDIIKGLVLAAALAITYVQSRQSRKTGNYNEEIDVFTAGAEPADHRPHLCRHTCPRAGRYRQTRRADSHRRHP